MAAGTLQDVLTTYTSGYTPKVSIIGRLPLVPYFRPGDPGLADAVGRRAIDTHAMLLAHHGMIVCERDLAAAVNAAEELEETARLFLMVKDRPYGQLTRSQVAELERLFPKSI